MVYCFIGIRVRCGALIASVFETDQPEQQQKQRKMIGVKRPFKLGAPKPPKSAKKKKLLKTTKPLPDPDDAAVIANPHADSMVQKLSDLMEEMPPPFTEVANPQAEYREQKANETTQKPDCEFGPPFDGLYEQGLPVTDVLEEGEISSAQEMVKNLKYVQGKVLEFPDKLPHLMGFRYKLLLEKCNPKELIEGQPPSLTWLEERYGHLVEKEFWYDRTVQLASTYLEICEGDVFDKTQFDLEQAVGHLVPFTETEQEYLHLMENYKKSRLQIDGRPTLEYLRKHHSKPPTVRDRARVEQAEQIPTSPEYLPSFSEEEEEEAEAEAMEVGRRYVPKAYCPIHEESKMTC